MAHGIGMSFILQSDLAMIASMFPDSINHATAAHMVANDIGYGVSPAIGAFFFNRLGYPGPFVFVAALNFFPIPFLLLCFNFEGEDPHRSLPQEEALTLR